MVESTSKGNKLEKVVIGIAVNVNQGSFAGKFPLQPTSVRKEFRKEVSREKFLSEILNCFEEMLTNISSNKQKVLDDWRTRCHMIGERIKIVDDEKVINGVFEDINENGFLLLKTANETLTINVGDLSLRQ